MSDQASFTSSTAATANNTDLASLPHTGPWIDGTTLEMGVLRQSLNPATGGVVGTYLDGDAKVADLSIEAAERAFLDTRWSTDAMLRSTALSRLAEAFAAHADALIDSLCLENGKLRGEAGFEVSYIPRALQFAAGLALLHQGHVAETRPGVQSMSIRQPVGPAGIIVPWNSPAYLCIRALAPALAAGCTAAVKMPAQAALTTAVMVDILASVPELPAGAVNIFVESGSAGARRLVDSSRVRVISFTGSTQVGRDIARAAAGQLKRASLELGGKTPHLVFDDADLSLAVPTIVNSVTVFAGQFCMAGSRVLVQRSIADQLTQVLAERLDTVRPGPATDPNSQIGPLIDSAAVHRVDRVVTEAIAAGAEVIVRGGPSTLPHLAGGAFYHPTLLRVNDRTQPILHEETFGPVQTLQVFDSEDDAIKLANDTQYGLSACVWSRDINLPLRVARALDAGLISINSWANIAVEFEEGGFNASGLGRLGGLGGLDDFLEYKQIAQPFLDPTH